MEVYFDYKDIPRFAEAMANAPKQLLKAMGKAFNQIGKSDTEKMRTEGLSKLNIRRQAFRKSFTYKAGQATELSGLNDLKLEEYTGAKPFRIFQDGGDINPARAHTLTILTDAARSASGKRKYGIKELREMIQSGQAAIIKTKAGPAVVLNQEKTTKSGKLRKGSKITILAWLKPSVHEEKRIDFYMNFEANASAHKAILDAAATQAIAEMEQS